MFILHTAMDYRYWDDPSDEFREGMGSLLPLWKFQYEPTRSHAVCEVQWSPFYQDLFAVGYGSRKFLLYYNTFGEVIPRNSGRLTRKIIVNYNCKLYQYKKRLRQTLKPRGNFDHLFALDTAIKSTKHAHAKLYRLVCLS